MRLVGKVVVVTGGGTGIGEAIARRFAAEGARVAITGRRKDALEQVVARIERAGGRGLALPGSVAIETDVQRAVEATLRAFGQIDVLVNNAGNLFHAGWLHEMTDQTWSDTIEVFLTGTFRFSRAVIPPMLRQGCGSIINISTVAALKAMPGFPAHAYAAAKAGVNMLTKTIAVQYAKQGIRCNAICPAGVDTPGVAGVMSDPAQREAFNGVHPVGRIAKPEEIAASAVYFASDESGWTTGSILTVDGGVSAQ
jgi:NAD(P)-dependent dehydrogenase (short-subunit alcohol dehydrogenase family)